MVRVLSIIAAVGAVILFIVAAIANPATTNVNHYVDWGLAVTAVSLGLFELSTVVERPIP